MGTEYKLGILIDNPQAMGIIQSIIDKEVYHPVEIITVLLNKEISTPLNYQYVHCSKNVDELANCSEIILFWVDKKNLIPVLKILSGKLREKVIVISFVEDLSLEMLYLYLDHRTISRAIFVPRITETYSTNTNVVYYCPADLIDNIVSSIENILNVLGNIQKVSTEDILESIIRWMDMMASNLDQSINVFADLFFEMGLTEKKATKMAVIQLLEGISMYQNETIPPEANKMMQFFDKLDFWKKKPHHLYTQLKSILISLLLFDVQSSNGEKNNER